MGDTSYTYDDDGLVKKIVTTRGEHSARIDFGNGNILAMTGFDGGQTSFENHNDGDHSGLPKRITCPNGLELQYEYNDDSDLSAVKVGTDRRVRFGYDPGGKMISYCWEKAG